MKTKISNTLIILLAAVGVILGFSVICQGYSKILPNSPCTPALPYAAEADHLSGAACVQMVLNSCPSLTNRHYNSQTDIYARIQGHNIEPTIWFSDPRGIKDTLMDPILLPCGNWSVHAHTNKTQVLGDMLYYMKIMNYLTPVNIGSSEHWVIVMGYHTDVEPLNTTTTLTLMNIFIYDPLPGNPAALMISGATWLTDSNYWGVPYTNPASTNWNNKYIAVIEPPTMSIGIRAPKLMREGPILPLAELKKRFQQWQRELRTTEVAGPLEILNKPQPIGDPILVDAGRYKYYIVPFENRQIVAIFNAYDGSFEEIGYFNQAMPFIVDRDAIQKRVSEALKAFRVKSVKFAAAEFKYFEDLATNGRYSPAWKVNAAVTDVAGKKLQLTFGVSSAGKILQGLETLRVTEIIKRKPQRYIIKQRQ